MSKTHIKALDALRARARAMRRPEVEIGQAELEPEIEIGEAELEPEVHVRIGPTQYDDEEDARR